jgi:hypothetical protein
MQPVLAPARGLILGRLAALVAALALLGGGIAVALLSSAGSAPAAGSARSPLAMIGGKPLQQASCEDWMRGSADERAAVVAALKSNVGGATPYGRGTTLSNADAYALFARACARPYAAGFMLYVVYARAAAFQGAGQRLQ